TVEMTTREDSPPAYVSFYNTNVLRRIQRADRTSGALAYEPVHEKSDRSPVSEDPRLGGSCAFPQRRSPKAARFFPMAVLGATGLPSMSALWTASGSSGER